MSRAIVLPASPFSPDYRAARDRFRSAAGQLGWSLERHAIGETGPDEETLTIDVAVSDGDVRERAVVISSGTHGVEGFFGSAVQIALLERWAATGLLAPVRWVFIHAVNPYGFAWSRRVDACNVDLNRNFLLPGETFTGAPHEYARLNDLLNPEEPPYPHDGFRFQALKAAVTYGVSTMRRAVAAGQYEFPLGLFFGGHEPTTSQLALGAHLPRWLLGCSEVVHLDLHTGLGRWAECRLLVDYELNERSSARVAELFDGEIYDTADSGRLEYRARGGIGNWCVAHAIAPSYLFAFVEVGTYHALRVLGALRAENQAHHWGALEARETAAAKARLREVFCPADERWRRKSLAAATSLIERIARRYVVK